MQGRSCSRLKFHTWSGSVVLVVLALVLGETLVESQYYLSQNDHQGPSRSQYYFYDDQSFFPGGFQEEGRAFSEGGGGSSEPVHEGGPEMSRRMFADRSGRAEESDEDEDDEEEEMMPAASKINVNLPNGRPRPVKLPARFNDRVNKRIKMSRKSKTRLHGDPDPIDDEDEEGRKPEARLLWPFSIEITKGQKEKGGGGWGGPGGYGSYAAPPHHHHPPPRTGLGFQFGGNNHKFGFDVKHGIPPKQHARIGFTKGRLPPDQKDRAHFSVSGGYGPQNGWGWDAFIEHEKHRLKYEILKLKAKKKIAVLQNKVELKKLFSMLLQKKIQALEWCYHEWLAHNGWGGGAQNAGWGGWGPISGPWGSWGEHGAGQHGKHPYGWKPGDLTDEEILNSKHYKKYRKKKKKKIKKLKKKLKFKRLVQKILQKHITYLDKIAPY